MKIITLSDHTAEQQKLEGEGREQHHLVAMSAWQATVDARAQKVQQRWVALVEATHRLQPLEAITGLFRWAAAALTNAPRPPVLARPSDKEEKWAGGQLGEQRVRACLERMLGDGWVVLAGYFNRGGEMDLLVVGPSAIVAVEVKYLNGVVHCCGQQWTRDKYDRFGNLVEQGLPVQDKKGRAPNRQINESADALEGFLTSRGQLVKVRRAVVLAHDASRLGEVTDPGVDFIGALASNDFNSRLRTLLVGGADHTGAGFDVEALVTLIQRDHAYHARRKAARESHAPDVGVAAVRPHSTAPGEPKPLPERIIVPVSARDHALPPFVLRQIDSLVSDVKALCASSGEDRVGHERVCQAVSGHLMSGARWTVLSAADGTLGPGPERELLRGMMVTCRQSFDFDDRTLSAIVVPVAVRLQSEVHAGQGVADGAPEMLSLPCLRMARAIGALRVAFGTRMYAAKDLFYADATKLRELLVQIEAGHERSESGVKGCSVRAATEPEWQMVYFLGVAVLRPGARLVVDTDEAQRELMNIRQHFAGVFTDIRSVAFNRNVVADAVCEGFWSLDVGVRKGEDLGRRHLLERVLATLDKEEGEVELWYAHALRDSCVRLLICNGSGAKEFRWELLAGESLDGFREGLAKAAAIHLPRVPGAYTRELDLYGYEENACQKGLSWVSQT